MNLQEKTIAVQFLFEIIACVAYVVAAVVLGLYKWKQSPTWLREMCDKKPFCAAFVLLGSFYFIHFVVLIFFPHHLKQIDDLELLLFLLLTMTPALFSLHKWYQSFAQKKKYNILKTSFIYVFLVPSALALLFLFFSLIPLGLQVMQCITLTCHGGLFVYLVKHNSVDYNQVGPVPQTLTEVAAGYVSHAEDANDALYKDLQQRLLSFFETEKPYLNPNISVFEVAMALGTNKSYLSRLLNDRLNQNFNQFVNSYRIREAQMQVRMEAPESLQGLCKKVGFISMATFTVAFKLNTGMTPGEWCKQQRQYH